MYGCSWACTSLHFGGMCVHEYRCRHVHISGMFMYMFICVRASLHACVRGYMCVAYAYTL